MSKLECVSLAMALCVLIGAVGQFDYESELAEQEHYCSMVFHHHWPDYRGTYRRECFPPKPAQP